MKKINLLIFNISFILIISCNGGGTSNDEESSPMSIPSNQLIPLNISLHDLNNNPIDYIDVTKVGSHTEYKLTFTNPNSVSVTGLSNLNSGPQIDLNWLGYQASPDKKSYPTNEELEAYDDIFNPGEGQITDYFYKTTNDDDCFNKTILQPNDFCSFYTLAVNYVNFNESDFFSYPLAYYIEENGNNLNVLNVQQYSYTEGYGFLKESMINLDKQFITYKIIHENTPAPESLFILGNEISMDGTTAYLCDDEQGIYCGKYPLFYESSTNTLTLANNPSYSFTLPGQFMQSRRSMHPVYDGESAWYVAEIFGEYTVANSNDPTIRYRVPNIQYAGFDDAVAGLDGSFWFNPHDIDTFNADVYIPGTESFAETNIFHVMAIGMDGTVLGADMTTTSCYRNPDNNYQYQEITQVQNYVIPLDENGDDLQIHNNIYIRMNIPNLYTSYGESLTNVYGYYKLHTENGKCELESDDFIVYPAYVTNLYGLESDFVVPLSDIYLGK